MFDLRYYQKRLTDAALGQWLIHQSTAIIAATGTGKTEMYLSLAVAEPGRVLVLAHRDYLLTQPVNRLASVGFASVGVEKAEHRAQGNGRRPKIVFASVQTLGPKSQAERLEEFDPFDFSLLIVDEAHRATSPTYRFRRCPVQDGTAPRAGHRGLQVRVECRCNLLPGRLRRGSRRAYYSPRWEAAPAIMSGRASSGRS